MNLGTDFHGWNGSSVITNLWHKGPTMQVSGSATFYRNSASDKYVHYEVEITSTLIVTSSSSSYGYPVTAAVIFGGNRDEISNSYNGTTYYGHKSSGGTSYGEDGNTGEVTIASSGGSGTKRFSGSVECTDNNTNLDVIIWCNGGGYHGCDSGTWGFPNVIVGSMSTNDITHYNPHSNPTISLNTSSWISKAGASRSINYSYTTDGHSAIIYYNINNSGDWSSIDNLPRWFRFRYY